MMSPRLVILVTVALAALLTACSVDAPPGTPGSVTAHLGGQVVTYAGVVSRR